MKKLAVLLALVFVLGIVGTAAAAPNPFVDVPANHWAYKAVQKLYDQGIVKGTGDKRFRGQQTMTRYEMAQVVAQAMAAADKADKETKALIDKLQVEFSDELNKLGVRVAALEKKVGSVKVSGNARFVFYKEQQGTGNTDEQGHFNERFRLNFDGEVNDTLKFGSVFAADNNGEYGTNPSQRINQAWIEQSFANGDVKVRFGRMAHDILTTKWYGDTDGCVDGVRADIKFGEGGLLQVGYQNLKMGGGLDPANYNTGTSKWTTATVGLSNNPAIGPAMFAQAYYPFFEKKLTVGAYWLNEVKEASIHTAYATDTLYNLFGFGASYDLSPNWIIRGDYMTNNKDIVNNDPNSPVGSVSSPKGYVIQLIYDQGMHLPVGEVGPLNAKKAGDFRITLAYQKNDAYLMPSIGTTQAGTNPQINAQGFKAQFDYAIAKNWIWQTIYFFNMKQVNYTAADQPDKPKFFRTQFQVAF